MNALNIAALLPLLPLLLLPPLPLLLRLLLLLLFKDQDLQSPRPGPLMAARSES
jgi:hypothetical protein